MATVYLASDVKHSRAVAVKVLKPELAASIGADRFLKEIEIAAGLTHPHVVPLHDSGEIAGFLYFVMPYIDGESLRGALNREQTLKPAVALEITARIGDALGYAHRQGVVHRDIKPENILFAEGHPMVADFGIARAVSTAGGVELTRTGFPIGTPGYMSPEQAAGIRELDPRTDVYSLACVCYEMLVGETPGLWLTDEAVKLGRFIDASPNHRDRLDALSGSVELALARALALQPTNRYGSVDDFLDALLESTNVRRQYSDRQVRAIVKHAAEMQLQQPTEEGAMSLGAVQQIAAEVGIAPERVEQAAHDLERPRRPTPPVPSGLAEAFLGAPTLIRVDKTLDYEVPTSTYEDLVSEIRLTLGSVGQVGTLGKSLTWSTAHSAPGVERAIMITVSPRNGSTRIRIEERIGQLAGGLFGGIVGGGGGGGMGAVLGISLGALQSGTAAVVGAIGWVSGAYFLARGIFARTAKKRRIQLEELTEHLAELSSRSESLK